MRRYVPVIVVAALLFGLALPGCASATHAVRQRFAAEHGCGEREVTVEDLTSGAYRASGCGRTATYVSTCNEANCTSTTIIREVSGEEAVSGPPSDVASTQRQVIGSERGAAPEAIRAVSRVRTEAGWALETTAQLEGARVSLHAVPSADPRRVWWSIRIPTTAPDETCSTRVLVDGTRVDLEVVQRHPVVEGQEVRSLVDLDVLTAFATAARVIGQTCGHEWVVGPEAQGRLLGFVERVNEESALSSP
ncbi:hypothetical protein [Sandaracinus amylolyticus]|uniref:Lipoprotein n=1 Tax=Sandaracinus amylolyticus TaxID=927083 RepID=A0A0F6WAR9_9BACT|nr:hypothetical protein [Sandaracinus amylolyticus]AKF11683.1 hypothetical protein DB32_008832 [Sandaracinus amylolyticus]